ncbi:MAG: hypothetical protein AAFS13_02850 [Pseudomonadota bacterium]
MSWTGIGHIISSSLPPLNGAQGVGPPPLLRPSAQWTGTESSGFEGQEPVDPVRTTAKPGLHLLTPDRQHFSDTLDVGALAMANDGGSLFDSLGIERVVFHFEGRSVNVVAPSWRTILTARGPQTYFGFWARLARPSAGLQGIGQLYIEAIARDPTMQSRVIGPYQFGLRDEPYDGTLSVQPSQPEVVGERYQSIVNAIAYAKSESWINYRVTIDESGLYDIGDEPSANANDQPGWCEIIAVAPDVSIGKAGYTTDADARILPARTPIRFRGSNLTFDLKNVNDINSASGNIWCDGINITTTDPLGRNERRRGVWPAQRGSRFGEDPYLTECEVSDCMSAGGRCKLIRGGNFTRMTYDIFGDSECVVFTNLTDHAGDFWTADNPGVRIQYTGAEATATLERTGSSINNPNTATFTATWGSNTATFDCGIDETVFAGTQGDGYTVQDFSDWINSLPDWTATVLDPALADCACAVLAPPLTRGENFSAIDAKAAPIDLTITFNLHSDYYQQSRGTAENRMFAFNTAVDMEVQTFFVSPAQPGTDGLPEAVLDNFFVANAMYLSQTASTYYDPETAKTQIGRGTGCALSHLVLAHNSLNQDVVIRNDANNNTADAYCLFTNNVFKAFTWGGGNVLSDVLVKDTILFAGALAPSNSTNIVVTGDVSTLYVDAPNGDFTPAGDLAADGFVPTIPSDINREAYFSDDGQGDAAGAVRITGGEGVSLYAPPDPSQVPVIDLLAAMNSAGPGQSEFYDLTRATDTNPGSFGGLWRCVGQSNTANELTQAENNPNRRPMISSNGAEFASNGRGHVGQAISPGVFDIVMSFTKDNASSSGTLLSDQSNVSRANYADEASTSLPQSVLVDGNPVSTYDALHDALSDGSEHVVTIIGADFAGASELIIGRSSGSLVGTVRRVAVLDNADFPTNLADVRSLAEQSVAAV